MPDYFYDDIGTMEQKFGREIYKKALSDRRGFRSDQIGIPVDDDIWLEIFEDICYQAYQVLDVRGI